MRPPRFDAAQLSLVRIPFDDPDFIFELKHDGFRALAHIWDGKCELVSRKRNVYKSFEQLKDNLAQLKVENAVIDGEIVCLDEEGKSIFNELLCRRGCPVFYAFDLLYLNGRDLRQLPLIERKEELKALIEMIDGIHFGGQVLVVALGIAEGGAKHVLGVWQGATENTTVVKGLLEDLVDRGLNRQRRYLVVMDGSKALRAGVERVFGEQVEVQRCQIHKRRNVKAYLPENCQKDYDRRMRNAYGMNNYAEAKEALQKIFRQPERINPSAARSLEEGLEETLTVQRLGIGAVLRRKLATTNPIESCLSTVQRVARNLKRWREGDQPLRWTATGLLEAEKKFRRIKGYQEILLLKERLNPSRLPQKEVRIVEVA